MSLIGGRTQHHSTQVSPITTPLVNSLLLPLFIFSSISFAHVPVPKTTTMKNIMASNPLESSFSFSRRHFQWRSISKGSSGDDRMHGEGDEKLEQHEETRAFPAPTSSSVHDEVTPADGAPPPSRKKGSAAAAAVSKIRSALAAAIVGRHRPMGIGPRLTGTLFGRRRGHVHFALQVDPRSCPAVLIELATPTDALVREMASGLVRIALECERRPGGGGKRLLEEPLWRAYCNGKKCGYAVRRECTPSDWRVLRAVEPVSMGAGVLPKDGYADSTGDVMYMRAKFERVVGSKDSEAFYMMNPDNNGGPELSIYLLRV